MPKIYRFRSVRLNLLVGMLMIIQSLLFAVPASALSGSTITELTNQQRAAAGLPALSWNSALGTSAALKAQDMCAKNYWAHTSPDGLTPWSFMIQAGYNYSAAGENLAKGYSTDSGVISGWMASPTHRANVLSSAYSETGVAVMTCTLLGSTTTIVVAHYGSRYQTTTTQRTTTTQTASRPVSRTPTTRPTVVATKPQPVAAQSVVPASPVPQIEAPKIVKITPDIIKYAKLCSLQNKEDIAYAMKLLGVSDLCR